MMMLTRHDSRDAGYLRAAGRAPLALYDPVVAMTMRERTFRARLARQLLAGWAGDGRRGGLTICDAGCGTGTFATALAGMRGAEAVIAVDGDAAVLERARTKEERARAGRAGAAGAGAGRAGAGRAGAGRAGAGRAGAAVDWRLGRAEALPLGDESCDRVVLSLVLHHLSPVTQRAALGEARRVLRPGGRLHVADWGPPRDPAMRVAFRLLQAVDGVESTAPLARGELPGMLEQAGFGAQTLHDRLRTAWGVLELRSARRG